MLSTLNPATGQMLRQIEEDDADSITRKATAARDALPAWARVPLRERLGIIRTFGEQLAARRDDLAATLTSEMGKPIRQSRNELDAMQGRLGFFLEHTERALADEVVHQSADAPGLEERIRYEPLGVVANISAWNYPYFVGSNVFVPALLAGNTVLYKPSEFASLTGAEIARLLYEAGIPQDVFIPVVGGGKVGEALLAQPVDGVFFTGSVATGKRIAAALAGRFVKLQLELGGKDPIYVCEDVDVKAAAAGLADGAFYNTGQSCCSVERIYVNERIFDAFIEAFVAEVRRFKRGDPTS